MTDYSDAKEILSGVQTASASLWLWPLRLYPVSLSSKNCSMSTFSIPVSILKVSIRSQLSHLSLYRKQKSTECCVLHTVRFNRNKNKCKSSIVVLKKNRKKQERIEPIQFIVHVTAFEADALR